MMRSRFIFTMVLLLVPCFATAQAQSISQLSPGDLVNAVIRNELNPSDVSEIRWKYLLIKEVDGKQETREVVETKSGSLDRLIAIADRPTSATEFEWPTGVAGSAPLRLIGHADSSTPSAP